MKNYAAIRVIAVFFVVVTAIFGALFVLDAITMDTLKDSIAKVGGISLIAAVMIFLINLIGQAK